MWVRPYAILRGVEPIRMVGGPEREREKESGGAMSDVLKRIVGIAEVRETVTVDLGDFHESYRGAVFEVWVTPTRAHLGEWGDVTRFILDVERRKATLTEEEIEAAWEEWRERALRWYVVTWGMDVEEARQIRDVLQEMNPLAWDWLTMRTSQVIGEYRRGKLKN